MLDNYKAFIEHAYSFPQGDFRIKDQELNFHDVAILDLIKEYGSPLKLTYLPKIRDQIKKAEALFAGAFESHNYAANYRFCYCTKVNHNSYALDAALSSGTSLETSSARDIDIIFHLHKNGKIDPDKIMLHNGFKDDAYLSNIVELKEQGFSNSIPILDNARELDDILEASTDNWDIGLRIATEEEADFDFYSSRMGLPQKNALGFYFNKIAKNERVSLKMLHFFVETGITDSLYYWGELNKAIQCYCELKEHCGELNAFNIGGGLPIMNSLGVEHDYAQLISEIVKQIKSVCDEYSVPVPDIYTEFGKFTVGESEALIFSILREKKQNENETWYVINNSLMNTLPDNWGLNEKFVLLPINKWDKDFQRVAIGGLTCDRVDFYNAERHKEKAYLPKLGAQGEEALHIGFFHTGAYQEALGGYGGVNHCLIPSPRHVILDLDDEGKLNHWVFKEPSSKRDILKELGYE